MISAIDKFFTAENQWKVEMNLLRSILRKCKLTETYKWMHPCYTYGGAKKQSSTRESRIDKYENAILWGKGLQD